MVSFSIEVCFVVLIEYVWSCFLIEYDRSNHDSRWNLKTQIYLDWGDILGDRKIWLPDSIKKTLPMSISFPDVRITDHLEGTKYIQISGEQPFRWFPRVSNANLEYECWWNISNAPGIIIVYTLIYPHWLNIGCTPQKMMGKRYVSVLYMELLKMDLFSQEHVIFTL